MSAALALVGLLVVLLVFYWSAQSLFGMLLGGGPTADLLGFAGHGLLGLLGTFVGFAVAAVGVYAAEAALFEDGDAFRALGTTALAAVAIALVGWIPMVGPVLAVVAWLGVLFYRYDDSWVNAVVVGGVSWLVAFAITGVANVFLGLFGSGLRAVGIPGI